MKFLFQPCNFPCPGLQQRTSANHRWSWGPEPTFEVNISDHFSWTLLSPKLLSGILWVTWSKRRLLELLVCRTGEEKDEIIIWLLLRFMFFFLQGDWTEWSALCFPPLCVQYGSAKKVFFLFSFDMETTNIVHDHSITVLPLRVAGNLSDEGSKDDHLVVVVVRGG